MRPQHTSIRTFGVEEELLLVDADSLSPLPVGEWLAERSPHMTGGEHEFTTELQQEQVEVVSPPQTTLAEQVEAIRTGRALADKTVAEAGGRVVALPAAPGPVRPHVVPKERLERVRDHFGLTALETLTCGFHVHVQVHSREEGVAIIDRIRVWLPTLLALSANSPFWGGVDSKFASYRYQVWTRWPTAGPTEFFGDVEAYDRLRSLLLATCVPLDVAMIHFDARLSAKHPTVEVRVADVCLKSEQAAVIAALVRALAETAARQWRAGVEPDPVPVPLLRAWSWWASFHGVDSELIDPATGTPAAAQDVIGRLLDHVRPVLAEYGEEHDVESVLGEILGGASGARRQREAYARHEEIYDVTADALAATHDNDWTPQG